MVRTSHLIQPKVNNPDVLLRRRGFFSPIDRIFWKLSGLEFLGKEQVIASLRQGVRRNLKPKTLFGCYKALVYFLSFCDQSGKKTLQDIVKEDLEAFIEHEQDRGLYITSIRTQIMHVIGFLRFLAEQDLLSERVFKRKIKFNLPDLLPRAINPDDIRQLLSVIKKPRDRAFCLLLLRTGMRIGELLNLTINDLDIRDRKIHIYEGNKNALGRVVYLSEDALFALIIWLSKRKPQREFLFYGYGNNRPLAYSSARCLIVKYLNKSGLQNKGYTLHSLRHTCATELLNAGMRLECLQQLLGHQGINMTRRYARLSDKSREEEYFRAMAVIEQGGKNANI